ncbi:MAG: Rpn family recombination-promoting nuclease/putative transposase [Desulfonatronovibrio sp. MSAO_Bac4]|nr:MAG: Rpn family recombination-promoting nuclease/putative transposase [Desulfonatronovibrio sp. MSAO_Bac4]
MYVIRQPHDKIFKRVMTDRDNAISMLKNILPAGIKDMLVLEDIQYEKDSFIPPHLKDYFSDLLTSVPVKGQKYKVKVYFLFEHKSYYVKNYPLQILRYLLEIWEQYQSLTKETGEKLPLIIPLLIAHPEGGWERKDMSDLLAIPSNDFKVFIPEFEHIVYDSVNENPEDYNFVETLKALLVIWRYFDSPDFFKHLGDAFKLIKKVRPETKFKDFVTSFMEYLIQTRREEEYIEIQKIAEKEFSGGDVMQTIADMFRKEGVQEGVILGRQEGGLENAQDTLIDLAAEIYGPLPGMLPVKIKSIQSMENLRALIRKVIRTESLDEFTELVNRAAHN